MANERCLKGKCCGCTLGVTFKLRIYTWLFSRVLYVLSFIPGKVGYSLLQKSHLPNVSEWFSHLFFYESCRMRVRAFGSAQLGRCYNMHYFDTLKKKKKEKRDGLILRTVLQFASFMEQYTKPTMFPALRLLVYCAWLIHKVVHLLQEPANNALLCFAAIFLYRQRVNRHKNTWSTFRPIILNRWKTFCSRNIQ